MISDKRSRCSLIDRRSTEIKFIDAIYIVKLIDFVTNITLEDDL